MIDALKWLRANLLPIIFGGMLLLQFLTWREIARFRYEYTPGCYYSGDHSCRVEARLSHADHALLYDIAHK